MPPWTKSATQNLKWTASQVHNGEPENTGIVSAGTGSGLIKEMRYDWLQHDQAAWLQAEHIQTATQYLETISI